MSVLTISATRLSVNESSGEADKNSNNYVLTIWSMTGLKNKKIKNEDKGVQECKENG